MMIGLTIEVKKDLERLKKLEPRHFNETLKKVLKTAILVWHQKYLPRHFTRQAYALYPDQYPGQFHVKKAPGMPLVRSGTLRDRLLSTSSISHISSTSTRATIKMNFGRPQQYTPEQMKKTIFAIMRRTGKSYKQAQNEAYSGAGYGNKAAMAGMIEAMHPGEIREICEFIRDAMYAALRHSTVTAWGRIRYVDAPAPFSPWGSHVDVAVGETG